MCARQDTIRFQVGMIVLCMADTASHTMKANDPGILGSNARDCP